MSFLKNIKAESLEILTAVKCWSWCSALWRCLVLYVVAVSEKCMSSIFMVEVSRNIGNGLHSIVIQRTTIGTDIKTCKTVEVH